MENQLDIKDLVQLLNQGVAHHRAGEKEAAEEKYAAALSHEGACRALLSGERPENDKQRTLLRTVFSQAYNNLGIFREEEKNYSQAINSFRHALDYAPGNVEALTNLARVFRKRRNLENGLAMARSALKLNPLYIPAIIQMSKICFALDRPGEAIEAVQKVAPRLEKNVRLNIEYGRLLEKTGQLHEARERLLKALSLEPDHVFALLSLGGINIRLNRYGEALENYQAILKIKPDDMLATTNVGYVLQKMGQYDEAANAYKMSLSYDPGHQETLSHYCSLLEMTGKPEEALMIVEQVLAMPKLENRPYFTALLTKAKCLRRLGREIEAIETLKTLLGGPIGVSERSRIFYELGRAYDSLDQTGEALQNFEKANIYFLEEAAVFEPDKHQLADYMDKMLETDFSPLLKESYRVSEGDREPPVFVTGFLMGGTDILGAALARVPEVRVLEDLPIITGLRRGISRDRDYPVCLKDLGAEETRQWVAQYYQLKKRFSGASDGGLTVNTYPLDFIDLPLILKLFPDARIVFVTLHPLDVVMNCYMKDFIPNPANLNFATFEDIAATYEKAMKVWQKYKKDLRFDYIEVGAEALLDRPEKEIGKILEFIDPEGKTNPAGALTRDVLSDLMGEMSLKYPAGRWKTYKKPLKGVKKTLDPVIRKLGY